MYDYAYSAKPRSANPPKIEVRIATIHFKIAAVMDSDVDDMLVFGHSSGVHLGVSILSDLFEWCVCQRTKAFVLIVGAGGSDGVLLAHGLLIARRP